MFKDYKILLVCWDAKSLVTGFHGNLNKKLLHSCPIFGGFMA